MSQWIATSAPTFPQAGQTRWESQAWRSGWKSLGLRVSVHSSKTIPQRWQGTV